MELDSLVQEKIEADADFQAELDTLEEDERNSAMEEKRKEILQSEFTRLSKSDELAKNYKIRAEKAEAAAKAKAESKEEGEEPTGTPKKQEGDLSSKDLFALMKANIHEDDVDEVIKAAKLLNLSVPEAIKDSTLQTILTSREEKRKVADATNTKTNRSSRKGISERELLANASKGEIPDAGTEEAEKLFWAKRGGKRS